MSGYDRISVPDRLKFSELEDDPQLDEWGLHFKPHQESSLKRACDSIRRKPLKLFISIGCVVIIVFIILIAVIVRSRKSQVTPNKYPEYQDKDIGLVFQPKPEDNTIALRFSPFKYESYGQYVNQLDAFLHDYNQLYQQDNTKFDDCKDKTRPANKTCRWGIDHFGEHDCSHLTLYGYGQGTPCVVLHLKVPPNARPVPVRQGEAEWEAASVALGNRYSQDFIGVSCNGTTTEDEELIGRQREPVLYFPPEGFPTYLFPNNHLPPLATLKLNTVADLHDVSITCRAWVGSLGSGPISDTSLFSTTFIISKYGE